MSEHDPIDPSKMIGGRRAMTQSHRKERQRGHIPKRGRGRRGGGGSRTSQPSEASQAQPEESQVVDPTQAVEYLNYQDHHDVTDGGYDEQYMPEQLDKCQKSVKFMLYFKHFLLLVLQVIDGKAEK